MKERVDKCNRFTRRYNRTSLELFFILFLLSLQFCFMPASNVVALVRETEAINAYQIGRLSTSEKWKMDAEVAI